MFKNSYKEELGGLSGRVADPHQFNADPDPAFRFKWDVYPAPHQSGGNLQPLVDDRLQVSNFK
jgi:hypothetical protein